MPGKKKIIKQFNVGDFVFAKVRGFRAWPARILKREKRKMYQVYFYGTCDIAKVGVDQLYEYDKCKMRLGNMTKNATRSFKNAMNDIKVPLANPNKDRGYFQAKANLATEDSELHSETSSSAESSTPKQNNGTESSAESTNSKKQNGTNLTAELTTSMRENGSSSSAESTTSKKQNGSSSSAESTTSMRLNGTSSSAESSSSKHKDEVSKVLPKFKFPFKHITGDSD